MVDLKIQYQKALDESGESVIFQSVKWLDAVAGPENWIPLIARKGTFISAVMPIVTKNKYGIKQVTIPALTPYLGPVFNYPIDLAEKNKASFEQKALNDLISQIPSFDRFITQCDFKFTNWLPFSFNDFNQTTRYSYLLDTNSESIVIFNNFKSNIQKEIKKAEKTFSISTSNSTKELFELYQNDFNRKKAKILFDSELLERLYTSFGSSEQLTILHAKDKTGVLVAAFCLVNDSNYMHYLLGAVDFTFRNKGVMSLLMWKAIEWAKSKNLTFNFEGSMNPNIARFFASFGGELTPYFQITKANHSLLKQFTKFNH